MVGLQVHSVTEDILKPDSHSERKYRYFELENGLKCVVAHDPKCLSSANKAAAALCVNVGKLQEPKNVPGLAHFCEHMLFLGTEKYPEETDYKEFAKKHGGVTNASTSDTYTCYKFDISPDYLEPMLDRFAQFFISPKFTPSAVDREINAVDSEHQMRITDDFRRQLGVLLVDVNDKHPYHWGSGNAETLRDNTEAQGINVHSELLKFYDQYYSSNQMSLCVLGKENLDELQSLVEEKFSSIKNKNLNILYGEELNESVNELPIKHEAFVGQVKYCPSKDLRRVCFKFLLPWQLPKWRTKPSSYLSHLIGHEGKGSLLSALKTLKLATGLSASSRSYSGCYTLFEIRVIVTEDGLENENINMIGKAVFAYLKILQTSKPSFELWKEEKTIREQHFQFQSDQKPYIIAPELTRMLHLYPPQHVLAAPSKIYDFDPDDISRTVGLLTVENLRLHLVGKRYEAECTALDPWYNGKYIKSEKVNSDWFENWKNVSVSDAEDMDLNLPQKNAFLAENLSLRDRQDESSDIPIKILDSGLCQAWWKQDDKFGLPKSKNVRNSVITSFWCTSLMEELNEYAYDAEVAGLYYSLSGNSVGVTLMVAGFNDKLELLLDVVVNKVRTLDKIKETTFELVKDKLVRSYRNAAYKQKPYVLASHQTWELLRDKSFPMVQQLEEMEKLTPADVTGVNEALLSDCFVEALYEGNVTKREAFSCVKSVMSTLDLNRTFAKLPVNREATLPEGLTQWNVSEVLDEEEKNNCVRFCVQIPHTLSSNALLRVLSQSMQANFYADLRTKQQLGYVVTSTYSIFNGFLYFICYVQTEYPLDYVQSRIEEFLAGFWPSILNGDIDENDFNKYKDAVVTKLALQPKSYTEEFGRHWSRIVDRSYEFYKRRDLIDYITGMDMKLLQSFITNCVLQSPRLYVLVKSPLYTEKHKELEAKVSNNYTKPLTPDRVWQSNDERTSFHQVTTWARHNDVIPALNSSQL